ncbi:hypothetical protein JVU11DRAFT_2814 [Chiua virens]|nr:hypothetical protein JVU11DRAFT_2814 [Chiua virens]
MSSLPLPLLHPIGSPRKHRIKQRTALVALFSLLTSHATSSSSPTLLHVHPHTCPRPPFHTLYRMTATARTQSNDVPLPSHKAPQLLPRSLLPLAAFIAALPHNVVPSSVDPHTPLDPQLILDFDPRSESAKEELERVVEQVWSRFPVILFTKARLRHSSDSREIRAILSNMRLKPTPLVVEADQREDAQILLPLLNRLTHVPTLPVLLIGGQPVGSGASDTKDLMGEIRRLHENGELARSILEAGAVVVPERKKGKGKNPSR